MMIRMMIIIIIDVAISGDRNVIKTEAEKILKYKDLTIEIQSTTSFYMKMKNNST
jgi:hypothetical protein